MKTQNVWIVKKVDEVKVFDFIEKLRKYIKRLKFDYGYAKKNLLGYLNEKEDDLWREGMSEKEYKAEKFAQPKFDSKAVTMWKVGKEQEELFRKGVPEIVDEIPVEELFKLIRGTEYRRGKEEGIIELKKELMEKKE